MANAVDRAVRAQGGFVVKPHQVKAMILAAHRAYDAQAKLGLVDDGVGFDAWRRATLHDVVGAAAPSSFRAVTQRDYAAVVDYFLRLAGEGSKLRMTNDESGTKDGNRLFDYSINRLMDCKAVGRKSPNSAIPNSSSLIPNSTKAADERRRALWALNLVEGEVADRFGGRGGARSYADALFWNIHKTDRRTANARQVWAVIFTLRNRAAKTRAKTALGAHGASDGPLPPPHPSERFPAFSRGF